MKEQITKAEREYLDAEISKIDWSRADCPVRRAIATKIVENVKKDVYTQDLVPMFCDVRRFKQGEELQFGVTKGLRAHYVEPGGYGIRSMVTKEVVTMPKRRVNVSLELDIGQLRAGRYGTIADFKKLAAEQLLIQRNYLVWETIYGAFSSTTTDGNYATFASSATAGTKRTALNLGIEYVEDNTAAGCQAVVGRYGVLSWLEDITYSNYGDKTLEKINQTGYVGVYKGQQVIRLKSGQDSDGNEKVDANNIMILGKGTCKFGIVDPGLEVFEQVNGVDNFSWTISLWEEYGCVMMESWKNYRILVT